jgi:nicotinate-nucleotide adenylyltransferase
MPDRAASMAPVGILGGTFDPVHFGHLRLAEEACLKLELAKLTWIPAGHPPHRQQPCATAAHRLAMVQLATAGNPRFTVDPSEALSDAPSYSVTTLTRLRQLIGPECPLTLILGADAFAGITSWHRYRQLFELAHLAVATRPGYTLDTMLGKTSGNTPDNAFGTELQRRRRDDVRALQETPAGNIVPFAITALDISATSIRAALAARGSARYLLPDPVLDYIARHRLYLT